MPVGILIRPVQICWPEKTRSSLMIALAKLMERERFCGLRHHSISNWHWLRYLDVGNECSMEVKYSYAAIIIDVPHLRNVRRCPGVSLDDFAYLMCESDRGCFSMYYYCFYVAMTLYLELCSRQDAFKFWLFSLESFFFFIFLSNEIMSSVCTCGCCDSCETRKQIANVTQLFKTLDT